MPDTREPPLDLLPARMLNEFVYCPRLFFYEHVEGVFVHNADTLRGSEDHKRVDGGKGEMPKAARKRSEVGDQGSEDGDQKSEVGGQRSEDRGQKSDDSAAAKAEKLKAEGLNDQAAEDESVGDDGVEAGAALTSDVRPLTSDVRPLTSDSRLPTSAESSGTSETIHSRSVMLGSESLGVVAKLDLVEITLEAAASSQISDSASQIHGPRAAVMARPVEYKAGAPRVGTMEGSLDLWDTDRIQLGLQILLLRENGYACDEGVIFYRQTRQRVRYVLTTEEEAWIRRTIAAARACTEGTIPAPLDHSPKCPRCSLVSVCLPDETRLLRSPEGGPDAEFSTEAQMGLPGFPVEEGAATDAGALADALAVDEPTWDNLPEPAVPRPVMEGGVRRLIAPDVDTKALYVNTPGVSVTKKGETVVVKDKGGTLAEVRIKDLHHLAIFGPAALSTALVQTLCERDVPVSYFSMGGWFYGLTRGHGLTNVFTRIQQFKRAGEHDQALPLARLFIYGKIRNQRTLLMRNHVEPPPVTLRALKHAASAALAAGSHATLLGIEGAAALHYFRHFSGMIKGTDDEDIPGLEETSAEKTQTIQQQFSFDFKTRNRRPPRDPVNALLSLAYSLLARDCTIAACAVGFDPYIGFFHQPRFGRPALALDMMEEFRPLIADSVVLTAINNRMLGPADFVQAGDAVNLSTAGRKRFLFVYEKRMSDTITHPVFDYKVSYRRALELQFRMLARTLTGEIERYVPFMTR